MALVTTKAVQLAPRQLDLFGRAPPRSSSATPFVPPAPVKPALQEATVASAPLAAPSGLAALMPPPPPGPRVERPPSRQETLSRARALAARIAAELGPELRVLLTVHDNRSTMLSFRRQPPLLKLRAHHMFLEAPAGVVKAIADYAGRGKAAAGAEIDDYIARQQERIRAYPAKDTPLEARGRCFDLQALFDEMNAAHFDGAIQARIGWGRQTGKRRRKTIRLGVYDHKLREIRIHPALDRPDVPRYFVEFIVFHEMLHQLFPSERGAGRHVHHPRAFRVRERAFPRYAAAMAWEKEHIQQLLRR